MSARDLRHVSHARINNACNLAQHMGLGARCSRALLSTARMTRRAVDGREGVTFARVTCALCHVFAFALALRSSNNACVRAELIGCNNNACDLRQQCMCSR